MKTSTLFERGSALGMKKWLTFQRNSKFEIRLTAGSNGQTLISMIEPPAESDAVDPNLPRKIKVKARLSLNSIVSWETAQLLIEEEVEEMVKEKRPIDEPMTDVKEEVGKPAEK